MNEGRIMYFFKSLRCLAYVLIAAILEVALYNLKILDVISPDIIPGFSIIGMDVVVLIIIVASIFAMIFVKKPHSWFFLIKRYCDCCNIIILGLEIIMLFKSSTVDPEWLKVVPIIEAFGLLFLINIECSKYIEHNVHDSNSTQLYVEKPIVGKEYLTAAQKKAFDQLTKLIDERSSEDSFNIGLIGPWGCGKSSIINTLVKELSNSKKYFVLRIGVLELNNVGNVVSYIQGYLEDLLSKYEISLFNKVRLLSSLSLIMESKTSIKFGLNYENKNSFSDIEKERVFLDEQIEGLLKRSKRKNIILIVEDADRNENKEKILKLMAEFSGIKGFIGIICLDNKNDYSIRPKQLQIDNADKSEQKKPEQELKLYHDLDKYVHVRVRVEDDSKVLKNQELTKEIINQYREISETNDAYIHMSQKKQDHSLFSFLNSSTSLIDVFFKNDYDILTDIVFTVLSANPDLTLADYLNELTYNYVISSKESSSTIIKFVNSHKRVIEDQTFMGFYFSLVDKRFFENMGQDYIQQLRSNVNTCFFRLIEVSKAIDEYSNRFSIEENTIAEVWFRYMNKDNLDYKYDSKNNDLADSQVMPFMKLVFSDDELKDIDFRIKTNVFASANVIVKQGIERCLNLYMFTIILLDFFNYISKVANNYRLLKMQLREADLLQLNYLDYLMGDWDSITELQKHIDELIEHEPFLKDINYSIPSIRMVIDTILFANYIQPYAYNIQTEELNNCKAYLVKGEKNYIVLSAEDKPIEKNIYISIPGFQPTEIDPRDKELVENSHKLIWGKQ